MKAPSNFPSIFFSLIVSVLLLSSCTSSNTKTQVLIIGGGASGVAASVQAARLGANVIIVEETTWLGGMLTSSGVSAIDGNHRLPSGFWGEFRDSLAVHYGSVDSLATGWVSRVQFEPSVGNKIFNNIVKSEKNINVYFNSKLQSIKKTEQGWTAVITKGGTTETIETKVLIDGTELGDVAKLAGVDYQIGMDAKSETGESIASEKRNNIIQDLTYVAILKDYAKDVTIEKPEGYDPSVFACAAINDLCITPKEPDRMWDRNNMITYGKLPNHKYMINWPLEGNDYYLNLIELTEDERKEELKKAKHFTMCFLYFIQKELGFNTLGLADDEFPTDDKLPFIPYHRESRRIDGEVRFALGHITDPYTQTEKLYRTAVAVGDYPVDHHHARYEDYENLPDLHFSPVPSYGLPLGTLIPKKVDNLIVTEKSISVTNIVNGTTRLQPVVLQIGQVAGALAALAIKNEKQVRNISVREIQRVMLDNGGYLLPYLDVEKSDRHFKTYQRVGATGILTGIGKNVAWSNETWLRINDPLLMNEIDFGELYGIEKKNEPTPMSYLSAMALIAETVKSEGIAVNTDISLYLDVKDANYNAPITRGEFAILIDNILNPFDAKDVNIKGQFLDNK